MERVPKRRLGNPYSCKPLLGRSSRIWSFKKPIPKQELGNEQNNRINELTTL